MKKEHITLTARNVELGLEPITSTLTRKYVLHDTDTRYYVQTSVLYLKYKYKRFDRRRTAHNRV